MEKTLQNTDHYSLRAMESVQDRYLKWKKWFSAHFTCFFCGIYSTQVDRAAIYASLSGIYFFPIAYWIPASRWCRNNESDQVASVCPSAV